MLTFHWDHMHLFTLSDNNLGLLSECLNHLSVCFPEKQGFAATLTMPDPSVVKENSFCFSPVLGRIVRCAKDDLSFS